MVHFVKFFNGGFGDVGCNVEAAVVQRREPEEHRHGQCMVYCQIVLFASIS